MRVLMVIGQFYPTIGGSERQCLLLSKTLHARGHSVSVITTWYDRACPRYEEIDGVPVERAWYPLFYIGHLRFGFGFLVPIFLFVRIVRLAREYDVIHVHQCLWPAFAAVCAARLRKKPVITKLANSGERFDLLKLQNEHTYGSIAKWCIKKWMNMFIWTSAAVRDDLKNCGISEERLIYIPNGVEIPNNESNLPEKDTVITFTFVGMLNKKKNVQALVKAVAQLNDGYRRKTHVVIVGDGPERESIENLIREEGVASYIMLAGSKDNVTSYLRASDVFVLPSFTEGLSNAALEAMAHSLPLIVSDAGGNRDLVRDGVSGVFIDPHDSKTLAAALRYMIDNPERRIQMGAKSRERVTHEYSIEAIAEQYEGLYKSLLWV